MILDKQTRLGTGQAVTASAGTTDYYDQKAPRDLGINDGPLFMVFTCTESVTAAGAATVNFQIQCDDNTGFSSPKTVIQSDAIGKATLVAGYQLYIPLPVGLDERYVRGYFSVGTGPLTAGRFTTDITPGIQKNVIYSDGKPAI